MERSSEQNSMAASEVLRDISPARILVVDDSQVMRGCLRCLLERHPHWKVCGEACDGRQAAQKAHKRGPDVIVLDFQMPEMNGFDGFAILLGGEINFLLGDLRDHRTLQSSTPLRTQSRI